MLKGKFMGQMILASLQWKRLRLKLECREPEGRGGKLSGMNEMSEVNTMQIKRDEDWFRRGVKDGQVK